MTLVDHNGWFKLASNHAATHKITKSSSRKKTFSLQLPISGTYVVPPKAQRYEGSLVTIDRRMKSARRWEIWDEFSDIATVVAKALLSGRVWVAISVPRGKI
jgi:hypothetical protein